MAQEIIMPALGMAQDTGRLVRWLKAEGEQVREGEPLMEVETDKALVEVEAPGSGVLAGILARQDEDVPVGRVIAYLVAPGESPPAAAPARGASSAEQERASQPAGFDDAPARGQPSGEPLAPPPPPPRRAISPRARRLAAERGLDIGAIAGTGPGGAVVSADLLRLGAEAAPPADHVARVWQAMAEHTTRSWQTAPHFFLSREVDASRLLAARSRQPAGVTLTDLLIHLVALTLAHHPAMNGGANQANVGLAVATNEGLVTVVVPDAARLSLPEVAERRSQAVERARSGRLRAADLTGATFTISNLGMYGVDSFLAILVEGQAGILAVGRVADRVIAVDGEPRVRPTIILTLSCDHRKVDGARAARFLSDLAEALEEPSGALAPEAAP
jgi:pyruvate dehydrogenase E2 component (dihydrolipoamide acetyltransferase)